MKCTFIKIEDYFKGKNKHTSLTAVSKTELLADY